VSSDGGEYQNLPIIIDTPDGGGQIQISTTPETLGDSKTTTELDGYYDNLVNDAESQPR